jgi:hypothetical protein
VTFPVTTADIVARWRPLDDDETPVGAQRIDDALMKLRLLRPLLEAAYDALPVGTSDQVAKKADLLEAIKVAVTEAVIRFLRNPDMNVEQSIGADGSVLVRFDTSAGSGIYIDQEDLREIDAALSVAIDKPVRLHVGSQALVSDFPWRPIITT